MESTRDNLVEVKRKRPIVNKIGYKAIIPQSLTSVSSFSQDSIVVPELNSKSGRVIVRKGSKREI